MHLIITFIIFGFLLYKYKKQTISFMFFSLILSFIYQFGSLLGHGTAIIFTTIGVVFMFFLLIAGFDVTKDS